MNKKDGMNYAPVGKPQPVVRKVNLFLPLPHSTTVIFTACATA
jgi:hypothetical protein